MNKAGGDVLCSCLEKLASLKTDSQFARIINFRLRICESPGCGTKLISHNSPIVLVVICDLVQ